MVQRNRPILIMILTAIATLSIFHYFLVHLYVKNVMCSAFVAPVRSNPINDSRLFPGFIYSLDSECQSDLSNSTSDERGKEFNQIFDTSRWGTFDSRSGSGSTIEGAYDWIRHLRSFIKRYSVRAVADIPCGDTYWQFSIRELNTIERLYFGGDISTHVIQQNQRLYGSTHRNKLFQYWDLVRCPISNYTYRNSTHEIRGNQFDLVIVRDALQHMHIKNALKAVQNVIRSGARYFALTTYPPNGKASAPNYRSIETNEPLPSVPIGCDQENYCRVGNIKDGDFYKNNINCYPFNFPLSKAILLQPSHEKFALEADEIHIYPIDDELKRIVDQYDQVCP